MSVENLHAFTIISTLYLKTLFPANTATSRTRDGAMLYKNFSKGHSHNGVKNTILLVISTETEYNKDRMSVVGQTFNAE